MALTFSLTSDTLLTFLILLLQPQLSLLHQDSCSDINKSQGFTRSLSNCHVTVQNGKLNTQCFCQALACINSERFEYEPISFIMESVDRWEDIVSNENDTMACLKMNVQKIRVQKTKSIQTPIELDRCYVVLHKNYSSYDLDEFDWSISMNADFPQAFMSLNISCLKTWKFFSQKRGTSEMDVTSCKLNDVRIRENMKLCSGNSNSSILPNPKNEISSFLSFMAYWNTDILLDCDVDFSEFSFKSDRFIELPVNGLRDLIEKNVVSLGIHSKGIKNIHNDTLPRIDSLKKLDLSDCGIFEIDQRAFGRLPNLEVLILGNNMLKMMSTQVHQLHMLGSLDLQGNQPPFAFEVDLLTSNPRLEKLDLSNMVLKQFCTGSLNFKNLKNLRLSNCYLNSTSLMSMSCTFPNLRHLDLSHNKLDTISDEFLDSVTELESLDLSHNRLSQIPYNKIIERLPNLKHIYLRDNKISKFLPLSIANTSALELLDLSSNQICSWDQSSVRSTSNALSLNLTWNEIKEVHSWMLQDFDQLNEAYLKGNKFDCKSCTLGNFIGWLNSTNTWTDFLEAPYTCHSPEEHFKDNINNVTWTACHLKDVNLQDHRTGPLLPSLVIAGFVASSVIVGLIVRRKLGSCPRKAPDNESGQEEVELRTVFRHDAFVSYCSADELWVARQMVPACEEQEPNVHLSLHGRDFVPGVLIMSNILDCIENSRRAVFVITPNFVASHWCQWELEMAKHRLIDQDRGKLILILLEEIDVKEAPLLLQVMMETETYLEWPKDEDGQKIFWRRFKSAIGGCRCATGGRNVNEARV